MGNAQSLLYPDNPNRRKRAQQLADDCETFQAEYQKIKGQIEKELGPYKDEMEQVFKAFGCKNMGDLDKLVKETATQEGIKQWQSIKTSVDGLSDASDIFSTAMAVVAIAGITISLVGALAGGFGFLAGIAVTSSILAILGIVALAFDAVTGAIQRSQLRDAINALFKLRIQIKYLAEHIRNVQINIGGIKRIYAIFKKQGYNKDRIIQELRESDTLVELQNANGSTTYTQVARDLLQMDITRPGGSWRNEDPDLEGIASSLDGEVTMNTAVTVQSYPSSARALSKRSVTISGGDGYLGMLSSGSHDDLFIRPSPFSPDVNDMRQFEPTPEYHASLKSEERLVNMSQNGMYTIPEDMVETSIDIVFINGSYLTPLLRGHVTIILKEFIDGFSAAVQLRTANGQILKPDLINEGMNTQDTSSLLDWVVSFANAAQAQEFAAHSFGPHSDITSADVQLRAETEDTKLYLRTDGRLSAIGDVLSVRYA